MKATAVDGSITGRSFLRVLVLLLILPSAATASTLRVTETEGDQIGFDKIDLFWSVENTYADIVEFAVGNSLAISAGFDSDAANASQYLTHAYIAYKEGSNWFTGYASYKRSLDWMDAASEFNSYEKAFLFTSRDEESTAYSGYLETGVTDGFRGTAYLSGSPFAANSLSQGTITGFTVPEPASVLLLGAGLIGVSGRRRRRARVR